MHTRSASYVMEVKEMKKFSIALGCTILMLGLVGCGNNNTANKDNTTNNGTSMNTPLDNTDQAGQTGNVQNGNATTNASDDSLKSNISHHVGMINGVNDSVVVVNDKDIIVGVDTDKSSDKAAIEKEVREMLEQDNAGYTVHVTSDRDIYQRISDIGDKLYPVTGQPVVDVTNDIKTLIQDMGKSIKNAVK